MPLNLRHPLIDQKESHRGLALLELAHSLQRLRAALRRHDPVTLPVMLAQIPRNSMQHLRLIVYGEDDWFRHVLFPSSVTSDQ